MEPTPFPPPGETLPRDHPLHSRDHAFQVKWDGVRMLAFVGGGVVRLQNRRLRDRTSVYPEFAGLARLFAREAILDGEVVVLHEGRPSFPRVLQRELAGRTARVSRLAASMPAVFACFDLLYLDGEDLSPRPWWFRQELLFGRAVEDDLFHLTRSFEDGAALFEAVSERGLEGVVAKGRSSPYVPGRRSRHWLKIKVRRRVHCAVGGYTLSGCGVGALLVGLYPAAGGGLVYIGRVGSGLDEALRGSLARELPRLARETPPFTNPPALRGHDVRWVDPHLTVEVAFSEWTEDLKLRAPSLTGFSRVEPEACRF